MTSLTSSHDHMKLGDHDHQFQVFKGNTQPSLSTVSNHNLSYFDIQDQGSYYPRESHQLKYQQEANDFALESGPSNDPRLKLCLWKNDDGQKNQISGQRHKDIPTKWLPSKLRFVRKMMSSDRIASEKPTNLEIKIDDYHKQGSSPMVTTESSKLSSTPIRVCSDCNTTKTPLWRSGPQGPKSLCNACGIRQRKARRALAAAAAAAANGTTLAVEGTKPSKPKVLQKDKKSKINTTIATCKKRSKLSNISGRKNKACFDELMISLSKNLAFHQVFPQDEKEAAILLMALSCNLVHG